MNLAAGGGGARRVSLQVKIEMRERVILQRAGGLAEGVELRQRRGRGGALVDEMAADVLERALQLRVIQRSARVLLEIGGGECGHCAASSRRMRRRISERETL